MFDSKEYKSCIFIIFLDFSKFLCIGEKMINNTKLFNESAKIFNMDSFGH